MAEENIVKSVCKELGITHQQLAEKIGVSSKTLGNIASSGKVSIQIQTAIELYVENLKLQKTIKTIKEYHETINNL